MGKLKAKYHLEVQAVIESYDENGLVSFSLVEYPGKIAFSIKDTKVKGFLYHETIQYGFAPEKDIRIGGLVRALWLSKKTAKKTLRNILNWQYKHGATT